VTVAKAMPGTPIKLLWSREEDTTHDSYHPISQCRMRAALDADNELIGLHMRIAGQSILATINPARMQNGKDPLAFQSLNAGAATPLPRNRSGHAQCQPRRSLRRDFGR